MKKRKEEKAHPPLPPGWRMVSMADLLAELAAGAEPPSASPGTDGDTKEAGARATRTRLYRSHSTDHRETQKVLFTGYRALCRELRIDPNGTQATTLILPYVIGVFNIGRVVMGRSIARAFHGAADPGEFPQYPIEVEVEPGKDIRWRRAGSDDEWMRAD